MKKNFKLLRQLCAVILVPAMLVFSCEPNDPNLKQDDSADMLELVPILESFDDGSEEASETDRHRGKKPRFRTLVKALVVTGLAPVVRKEKITIFAPTDAAFEALGITPKNVEEVENLEEILLYHVLGSRVFSTDLSNGFVPTLNGAAVQVSLTDGVFINQAQVTKADVRFRRGVIHVIDAVLLPPTMNIVEIAVGNPAFSILVQAVLRADLAGVLSSEGPFTVFAPTDDAFVELLGILGVSSLEEIPVDVLTNVLLYHVVEGRVFSSDLNSGPVTTLGGDFLIDLETLTIDDNGSDQDANLIADLLNIQGTNGVIHVIDKVLLP